MMSMGCAAGVAQASGAGKRDGGKALQQEQVARVNNHRAQRGSIAGSIAGSITTGGS
jgi:hypothetical protein